MLAAARPVVSTEATKLFGGNVPRTIALVIDHSLSMGYRSGDETRLDVAKRQAQAVIDDLKPGDQVAVIAVNDRARMLVAEPTVDHAVARQAIDAIQPTEARTDFSAGLREARKAVGKAVRGAKQIFLFTDNQETGWQFDAAAVFDEAWRQTAPKLVIVRTDDLSPMNASVSKVRFDAPFAARGLLARGSATVENHPPRRCAICWRSGSATTKWRRARSKPRPAAARKSRLNSRRRCSAVAGCSAARISRATIFPATTAYYFALPVYQTPRVLMVESGNGPEKARPGFFLRAALAAGAAGAPIKTVTPAELDELPIEPYPPSSSRAFPR